MVTEVPAAPDVGVNDVIAGVVAYEKLPLEVAVPPGAVTAIATAVLLVPRFGTTAVIDVAEFTVKLCTLVVPNWTAVAPVKLLPVIVTDVPLPPDVGVNDVIAGVVAYEKLPLEVAVPPGAVTAIATAVLLVPRFGTTAVIDVAEFTVKLCTLVVPNWTPVAPVKLLPVMVTEVPAAPDVGVNDVIAGVVAYEKLPLEVAVPPGAVTAIATAVLLVPRFGTTAVIDVAEFTVKLCTLVVPNWTPVAPVKLLPVIVTDVPLPPDVGVNDVIAGVVAYEKLPLEVAVPPGAVTAIATAVLLVPRFGTTAVIDVAEFTVKLCTLVVPNWTPVAPVKLLPVMVTDVPLPPDVGVNDVIVGCEVDTV